MESRTAQAISTASPCTMIPPDGGISTVSHARAADVAALAHHHAAWRFHEGEQAEVSAEGSGSRAGRRIFGDGAHREEVARVEFVRPHPVERRDGAGPVLGIHQRAHGIGVENERVKSLSFREDENGVPVSGKSDHRRVPGVQLVPVHAEQPEQSAQDAIGELGHSRLHAREACRHRCDLARSLDNDGPHRGLENKGPRAISP